MSENAFFALMSRMRYINRWGLMRSVDSENICEHSLMVSMLAHALAVIANLRFNRDVDPGRAATLGIFHDAPEILTGDLPTPVKYYNPEIKDAYNRVENAAKESLLSLLSQDLREYYRGILMCEDCYELKLVKAADKLSAYIKCIEEKKAGNYEFAHAAEQIKKTLEKDPLPELKYFMEHYLEAFSKTLDEQQIMFN